MEGNDHLRVVVDGEGNAEREQPPPPDRPERQPARLRTSKALPTNRAKFETQTEALQAFVKASKRGEEAVGAADVAAFLSITEATAALVNSFFVEAGFLTKEAKGRYKPVAEVNEYYRLLSFDPEAARSQLAKPLKNSWYYTEARKAVDSGEATEDVVINVLARAAGADGERRDQLELVLDWLAYAGLIEREGGTVRLTGLRVTDEETGNQDPAPEPEKPDGKGERATERQRQVPPDSREIVGFDFSLSVTGDDLAKLSPEQISALFEGVGKVMAIKAAMKED